MTNQQIKEELSNMQSDVNAISAQSSTREVEYEKIDNTPFTVMKQGEEWKITMGTYILSEGFKDKDLATQWVRTNILDVTLNMILAVVDASNKFTNQ